MFYPFISASDSTFQQRDQLMKRLGYLPAILKKTQFSFSYARLLLKNLLKGSDLSKQNGEQGRVTPDSSNRELIGYPNNHNYRIRNGEIIPTFDLFCRWRLISSLYPKKVESFLDLGSCKGFFVMDAASRPSCRNAVGIDVHEPFIAVAGKVKSLLGIENAHFRLAYFDQITKDPMSFGAPFQTILIINTYHYLFYGSAMDSYASRSHRKILSELARICSDRIVFSNPLEINDCPGQIRRNFGSAPDRAKYTEERFLSVAAEMFSIEKKGWLGKRPLYLLRKKKP